MTLVIHIPAPTAEANILPAAEKVWDLERDSEHYYVSFSKIFFPSYFPVTFIFSRPDRREHTENTVHHRQKGTKNSKSQMHWPGVNSRSLFLENF